MGFILKMEVVCPGGLSNRHHSGGPGHLEGELEGREKVHRGEEGAGGKRCRVTHVQWQSFKAELPVTILCYFGAYSNIPQHVVRIAGSSKSI